MTSGLLYALLLSEFSGVGPFPKTTGTSSLTRSKVVLGLESSWLGVRNQYRCDGVSVSVAHLSNLLPFSGSLGLPLGHPWIETCPPLGPLLFPLYVIRVKVNDSYFFPCVFFLWVMNLTGTT